MLLSKPLEFIQENLFIQTIDDNGIGHLVPLILNKAQAHYLKHRKKRNISVKARQIGMSTGILAINFTQLITTPMTEIGMVTHKDEISDYMLGIVSRFRHNLKFELQTDIDSMDHLQVVFPTPSGQRFTSSLFVGTAGARVFGRAQAFNVVHLTELAHWATEKVQEILAGVMNAVPVSGQVDIESTPRGRCYSEDTEVMTERGWVSFPSLTNEDYVACLIDGKVEFHQPLQLYKYENQDFLDFNSHRLHLRVTPDHEMWIKIQKGPWQFREAKDLQRRKTELYFNCGFPWHGGKDVKTVTIPAVEWDRKCWRGFDQHFVKPSYTINGNLFFQFLGYFLSEGHVSVNQVCITQNNGETLEKMKLTLDSIGFNYIIQRHSDVSSRLTICDVRLARFLKDWKKDGLPLWVKNVSKRQLSLLWHSLYEGDGSGNRKIFTGIYKALTNDVHEIALKLGYRAAIRKDKNCFVVSFSKERIHKFSTIKNPIKRASKRGVAYCCEVPGHLLFVRRNGSCCWSGNSGYFYDLYTAAKHHEVPYEPFFFPWWWCDRYQLAADSSQSVENDRIILPSPEENDLIKQFNLNHNQIRWRRWKWRELDKIQRDLFRQEYPENDVDCFLTSSTVFDVAALQEALRQGIPSIEHNTHLTTWKRSRRDRNYIIGVDVGEGLPMGNWSAAAVLDCLSGEIVAVLRCKQPQDWFATELQKLGFAYNEALIAVERNQGQGVLACLLKDGYANLYAHRELDGGEARLGFPTTPRTRPGLISGFGSALQTHDIVIYDEGLLDECMNFQLIDGKPQAAPGKSDDTLFAAMIAWYCREFVPNLLKRGEPAEVIRYA